MVLRTAERQRNRRKLAAAVVATLLVVITDTAFAAKCLFVSSYHKGYAWSDGVESGLRDGLRGKCEIKQFDMNTKRRRSEDDKMRKGQEAKALIESWKPDVVITADDNAAKYLIQPFFKDSSQRFIFCGVNWTVEDYGFPYANVTGMIEVAPIRPLLRHAATIVGPAKRALYLGAKTLSEDKNLERFKRAAQEVGIDIEGRLVTNTDEWLSEYQRAKDYDFVILGSNSGINDWDGERIKARIQASSTRLSVTNHGWMMPYAMLGFIKLPREQGEWAAEAALSLLSGVPVSDIPIVANRKWDVWSNQALLDVARLTLTPALKRKAKRAPL